MIDIPGQQRADRGHGDVDVGASPYDRACKRHGDEARQSSERRSPAELAKRPAADERAADAKQDVADKSEPGARMTIDASMPATNLAARTGAVGRPRSAGCSSMDRGSAPRRKRHDDNKHHD
jgi:hypothetical protein